MFSLALALAAFSLVDPVPADQMRDLATDRPDLTEGPFTVDAGHLQLELDAAVFAFDGRDVGIDVVGLNARVGLTDAFDLHLILPTIGATFDDQSVTPAFGDLLLRLKWNLLGNSGGDVAVALLPYLVVPADVAITAGLIIPVNFNLPWEVGLGSMAQVEVVRDALLVVSASAARSIVGGVGAYVEGLGRRQIGAGTTELWASTGTTWQATADLQFDIGARALVFGGPVRMEGFVGAAVRR